MEKKMRTGTRSRLLFCTADGTHINYYSYDKYLKENGNRILGKDNITTHVMRHTHTSLMAAQGVPLDVISRRLGHKNSKITREIYLHVTEQQKEKDRAILREVKLLS
jgi:integrase